MKLYIVADDTMYSLMENFEKMLQIYIKLSLLSKARIYHEHQN